MELKRPSYTEGALPPDSASSPPPATSKLERDLAEARARNARRNASSTPLPALMQARLEPAAPAEPPGPPIKRKPGRQLGSRNKAPRRDKGKSRKKSGETEAPACPPPLTLNLQAPNLAPLPAAGAAGPGVSQNPASSAEQLSQQANPQITLTSHKVSLPPLPLEIRTGINARQLLYAIRYLELGDKKQAAIAAGYSKRHSGDYTGILHRHPGTQAFLVWALDEIRKSSEINELWVKARLVEMYCDAANANDRQAALRALELIGKAEGMFAARVDHRVTGEIHHLLKAVSGRGKPSLDDRRRRPVAEVPVGEARVQDVVVSS